MASLFTLTTLVMSSYWGKEQTYTRLRTDSSSPQITAPHSINELESPNLKGLATLPVEILLSITDFLDWDDWICISLCSRQLFCIFNDRAKHPLFCPLWALGGYKVLRFKVPILRRLGRDKPKSFICHLTYVLCEPDGSECPGLYDKLFEGEDYPSLSSYEWGEDYVLVLRRKEPIWCHVYYRILFLCLQLARIKALTGEARTSGIYLDPSYTRVRTDPSSPEITCLLSINALHYPEGVCLRMQQINLVHRNNWELLFPRHDPQFQKHPPQMMFICIHLSNFKRDILFDAVVDGYFHGQKVPDATFTCRKCHTVAKIELHKQGSDIALIVTTWINLDSCWRALDDPRGPRQKVHCKTWSPLGALSARNWNERTYSPRVFFENASSYPLKDLRSRNLFHLRAKDTRYFRGEFEYSPSLCLSICACWFSCVCMLVCFWLLFALGN
ncbi:unnamed protein product [Penicillium salamii]|uniref:F-box domain-containing protein n=1 Tax=Penicillium salamii TaxID=1612424 RepID=A0A9W4JVT1_9EURO|nr:unnamed protein product [Penicillium salamii]CAG8367672.1 unnamed protein product [Penicillium salamii]CAG8417352.1 unnamed protein product [Penicillium salamii]CAG8418328.1 unnamed protein product [Penicillium salamii]